jgi:hypothetical protein
MGFNFILFFKTVIILVAESGGVNSQDSDGSSDTESGFTLSRVKNIHAGIYFFTFGILIDIFMVNVIFHKLKVGYFRGHYCQALIIFIIHISNQIYLWVSGEEYFENKFLLLIEIILLALFIGEFLTGIWVYSLCLHRYKFYSFYTIKAIHKGFGVLLYLVAKSKVGALVYFYCQLTARSVFYFVFIGYSGLIIICYYFIYTHNLKRTHRKLLQFKQSDTKKYDEIMKSIECEEFLHNDSIKSFREFEIGFDDHSHLSTIFSNVHWSAFEDKIFEIFEIDHSGGTFLVSWSNRKDITKYIHGLSALVVYEEGSGRYTFIKYKHSVTFRNYVHDNCLGKYIIKDFFKEESVRDNNEVFSRASINLFSTNINLLVNHRQFTNINLYHFEFIINEHIEIGPSELKIFLVSKMNPRSPLNLVNLDFYWTRVMGKYFMLEFANEEVHFLFGVMFLNPNYLSRRKLQLELICPEICNYESTISTPEINQLIMLSDSLTEENKSNFCPIVGRLLNIKDKTFFKMKGPLGFGLGFTPISSHSSLLVIKNEGIIPFVDFFEILFQKYMFELYPPESDSNLAHLGEEYRGLFVNDFSVSIYWILEDQFLLCAETLGLYHLNLLILIQDKIKNPAHRIIKEVILSTHNFDEKKFRYFQQGVTPSRCIDDILATIVFTWDKIIVSGEEKFKEELFGASRMTKRQFTKVYFL